MKARVVPVVLVLVAVLCVSAAAWMALDQEVRSDTLCGPVITQQNRRFDVCDDFYRTRYIGVGALGGVGVAAYTASVIVERRQDRREYTMSGPASGPAA